MRTDQKLEAYISLSKSVAMLMLMNLENNHKINDGVLSFIEEHADCDLSKLNISDEVIHVCTLIHSHYGTEGLRHLINGHICLYGFCHQTEQESPLPVKKGLVEPDGWLVFTKNKEIKSFQILSSWNLGRWHISEPLDIEDLSNEGKYLIWKQADGIRFKLTKDVDAVVSEYAYSKLDHIFPAHEKESKGNVYIVEDLMFLLEINKER